MFTKFFRILLTNIFFDQKLQSTFFFRFVSKKKSTKFFFDHQIFFLTKFHDFCAQGWYQTLPLSCHTKCMKTYENYITTMRIKMTPFPPEIRRRANVVNFGRKRCNKHKFQKKKLGEFFKNGKWWPRSWPGGWHDFQAKNLVSAYRIYFFKNRGHFQGSSLWKMTPKSDNIQKT